MLILAFDVRSVKAQQTVTIETKLFSYSIFVPEREIRAPNIQLTGGTPVRITFNASETIDFFCQNSWEYSQSSDSGWTIIYSHWSDKTAHMNRTYTIPTTDTWYFTLVNYEYHGIDVYNIMLYSLEVYEIYRKAAILLRRLVTDRIFKDGNHRTAQAVTMLFLEMNDVSMKVQDAEKIIRFIKGILFYSVDEIEAWLKDGKLPQEP